MTLQRSVFQIVLEKRTCQIPCQPTKGVEWCHGIVSAGEELPVRHIICRKFMKFRLNYLQCARR